MTKPVQHEAGVKLRDADKMALIPVKFMPDADEAPLPKPDWMRIRLPATGEKIQAVKNIMRKNKLHSVCEEAIQRKQRYKDRWKGSFQKSTVLLN